MFWFVATIVFSCFNCLASQSEQIVITIDQNGISFGHPNANGFPPNNKFPFPYSFSPNTIFSGPMAGKAQNPLIPNLPKPKGGKTHMASLGEVEMAKAYRMVENILIPVQIYGKTIMAIVDTGNQETSLSRKILERVLQIPIQSLRLEGKATIADGNYIEQYGPILVNATTPFGSILLRLMVRLGKDDVLLLGSDFLSHPMIQGKIDYGAKTITIRGKTMPFSQSPMFFKNQAAPGSIVYDNVY